MAEKRSESYDPVHAPVSGVDQEMRAEEIKNFQDAGDPLSPKPFLRSNEKIIFKLPGLKIIK